MSTYGREYAPNLFNSYQDWYDNYLMKCGAKPSKEEQDDANAYFLNKLQSGLERLWNEFLGEVRMNKEDTYCTKCIKTDVCGMEGVDDPATTYCAYKVEGLPVGEWLVTKAGYFKCSHCGYEPNFTIGEKMYPLPATVYCPKCGTKMPSEEKKLEERKADFLTKCLNIPMKED